MAQKLRHYLQQEGHQQQLLLQLQLWLSSTSSPWRSSHLEHSEDCFKWSDSRTCGPPRSLHKRALHLGNDVRVATSKIESHWFVIKRKP